MNQKIIALLRENARLSAAEIAERLGISETETAEEIGQMEKTGLIRGYTAIFNEAMLPEASTKVKALIEVRVTPARDGGFDRVAQRIAKYPEVIELELISGSFDLLITVEGDSLQQVANFVASKLAPIDGVLSTSTGFLLRKYKSAGRLMESNEDYERLKVCF